MAEALRQIGRLWATVFVVYALLLNAVVPSFAATADSHSSGPVICTVSTVDPSSEVPSSDHERHGLLCCVLCTAGAVATLPVPLGDSIAFAPEVQAPDCVVPTPIVRPGDPAAHPQSPRAPPTAA